MRLCSGCSSGHAARTSGARGARAGDFGRRMVSAREERACAVAGGAVGGHRVHPARARRLERARRVPHSEGTHTRRPSTDSLTGGLQSESRDSLLQ